MKTASLILILVSFIGLVAADSSLAQEFAPPLSGRSAVIALHQQAANQRQMASKFQSMSDDYQRKADATESFSTKAMYLRFSMEWSNRVYAAELQAQRLEAQADQIEINQR